jgi:hypothetical protein
MPHAWVRLKQWIRDMRFGIWKVKDWYSSVSLTRVARELGMYKLCLVGARELRWDKGGTV